MDAGARIVAASERSWRTAACRVAEGSKGVVAANAVELTRRVSSLIANTLSCFWFVPTRP
jgi:hypothetical protein